MLSNGFDEEVRQSLAGADRAGWHVSHWARCSSGELFHCMIDAGPLSLQPLGAIVSFPWGPN